MEVEHQFEALTKRVRFQVLDLRSVHEPRSLLRNQLGASSHTLHTGTPLGRRSCERRDRMSETAFLDRFSGAVSMKDVESDAPM